ncbi:MAG: CoA-binding protein [Dehalococcoidia bacterium]|nr:CoA-binding protein [Dehalococcoidia bacterium]
MSTSNLDALFKPKSIAIVGVSTKGGRGQLGGNSYLNSMIEMGFKGKLYPVNPKGGEIQGLPVYSRLTEIPGTVDFVISAIPASGAIQLMKDCIVKSVKAVHFFTSGFSELRQQEGIDMERELLRLAREHGIRIVGPNCMGVYCPGSGVSFLADVEKESGGTGVICQSGGNAMYVAREAARRGVRFSKVVSYGNASDVNETDLMEYMADDPETTIIMAYIEGVKDGPAFKRALERAARKKPVIVLKVGVTESGALAAASHTGSLAGADKVWDGLLEQVNAVRVDTIEEWIDMAVAFTFFPTPPGRRVALLGLGGGATVLAGDEASKEGLIISPFPDELRQRMSALLGSEAGTIINNPMDLSAEAWTIGYYPILKAFSEYDGIDVTIVHISMGLIARPPETHAQIWTKLIDDIVQAHTDFGKPVVVAIQMMTFPEHYLWMVQAREKCYRAGIAVFNSIRHAARSGNRLLRYNERLEAHGEAND